MPKSEMGKARALVARFEAGLRAQRRQRGGKYRERLPPSKAGKQATAERQDTTEKGAGSASKAGIKLTVTIR